ncbi:general stress protein [Neobacillus mesonae]|uniref:General stress protein n=1 Tax=Neobacillus mesonae TaxID=1193713 RepID=A0A3T0I5F7_9BACI|nr:general stress protein [Neobacillus mesonae]AZU64543.1 general stress protein [Neobacillus mesonae]MED4202933.1 general stress protein [Neobacillus mesonae]
MNTVRVVENGLEAKKVIEQFNLQGFTKDDIYLLAHDETRTEDLTDSLDIQDVGVKEEGFLDSVANVFRTRGDELRSKMESLGLSHAEAERFEEELDQGRVVVIASTQP